MTMPLSHDVRNTAIVMSNYSLACIILGGSRGIHCTMYDDFVGTLLFHALCYLSSIAKFWWNLTPRCIAFSSFDVTVSDVRAGNTITLELGKEPWSWN